MEKKNSLETEARISLLEMNFSSQSESVSAKLDGMTRVLNEIHNKLDEHILKQAITSTEVQKDIANHNKDIANIQPDMKAQSSKMWRIGGTIVTIITTILGGVFMALKG